MSWYTCSRSIGSSPFGGEPILAVDVLRMMTKGPGPAVRADPLGGANRSSMPRCQMSSDACTLTTRPTPSFLNHPPQRSRHFVAPWTRERWPASSIGDNYVAELATGDRGAQLMQSDRQSLPHRSRW